MLNTDKELKLYYSISEVAKMFDVNESLLRFWEKEFPQLNPKKGGRGPAISGVKILYSISLRNMIYPASVGSTPGP